MLRQDYLFVVESTSCSRIAFVRFCNSNMACETNGASCGLRLVNYARGVNSCSPHRSRCSIFLRRTPALRRSPSQKRARPLTTRQDINRIENGASLTARPIATEPATLCKSLRIKGKVIVAESLFI